MRFGLLLFVALALGVVGGYFHLQHLVIIRGVNSTYAVFILSGLLVLFFGAMLFHLSKSDKFDIIVASESIVAFGIASLTGGVVVGLSHALSVGDFAKIANEQIWGIAAPFLEGMFTAAVAPILAAVLRNIDSTSASGRGVDFLPGAGEDFKKMAELASALTKQLAALQEATKASSLSMAGFGRDLKAHVEQLNVTLLEARTQLKGMGDAANETREFIRTLGTILSALKVPADELKTLATSLSSVPAEAQRFKTALAEAQGRTAEMAAVLTSAGNAIRTFGSGLSSIRVSPDAIKDLGGSLGKLKSETEQAVVRLAELSRLIARFQGFIAHDRRGS